MPSINILITMIDIITTLSFYSPYDNPLGSVFTVIIFIIIVAYCCKSIDNSSENNNNHNSTQKPAKLNSLDELHGYYGEIDRNGYPKNWSYDPTWDDAYFEKWGTKPWFDDNPQDHEKDK